MNLSAIRCPSSRRPFSHNTVRSLRGGFEEQFRNGVRIVGNGGGEPEVEAQLRNYPRLGYTVIALINQEGANHPSIATMLDITESSGPGESAVEAGGARRNAGDDAARSRIARSIQARPARAPAEGRTR
jgi:hypothetical protein